MLGSILKELRKINKNMQRQIGAELEIDTAYVIRVENEEKQMIKTLLKKISKFYKIPERELLTIWLSAKLIDLVKSVQIATESKNLALIVI